MNGSQIHQLAVTNHPQVDQTFPMSYITARVFSQSIFSKIHQSYDSGMDAIVKRLEIVVPSHGVTCQQALSDYSRK